MSKNIMGLMPPIERKAREKAKLRAVLRWLRDETWSTPAVLGKVMGLNTRQGVYAFLNKNVRAGYLASFDLPVFKKMTQRIVGITAHGLAHAFDPEEPLEIRPTFEPSKVKLSTLQHEVDIQLLRLQAECAGWTHWTPGARLGMSHGGDKRPDAVALDPEKKIVALEIERTIKSTKRYEILLSQYLQAVAKGKYNQIVWLCPTADLAARLRRIVSSISAVPVNGKRVTLEQRHYAVLFFTDYAVWPSSQR
jgi:hypothetical protein